MDLDSIEFWETLKKEVDTAASMQMCGYDQIITDLKQALCADFPNTSVHTFGSRIMGLANADSDLDIYVDVDGNDKYSDHPTAKVFKNQQKIANAMRNSANWIFISKHGGRCPIVVVRHKDLNIECDISFSSKISFSQNKLVNYIFDLQPIARYMVIYLRGWSKKHNLRKFRGHIFILMVIFFLQVRGKLPSIRDLQANLSPNVGPWKTDFMKLGLTSFNMKPVVLSETETRNILMDFFSYYSVFNFAQCVVCPWLGKAVKRTKIKSHMPPGSKCFHKITATRSRAVIIQDIVHLNQNKAFTITESNLNYFKMKCNQMKMPYK